MGSLCRKEKASGFFSLAFHFFGGYQPFVLAHTMSAQVFYRAAFRSDIGNSSGFPILRKAFRAGCAEPFFFLPDKNPVQNPIRQ